MSHFAKIVNGIVTNVIVAEQDFIDSQDGTWVQTSYNTKEGLHYEPHTSLTKLDGGVALRGNYAGIGDIYDAVNDVFYEPKPHNSWTLDTDKWIWIPPIAYPGTLNAGYPDYVWDEDIYQANNSEGWVAYS